MYNHMSKSKQYTLLGIMSKNYNTCYSRIFKQHQKQRISRALKNQQIQITLVEYAPDLVIPGDLASDASKHE